MTPQDFGFLRDLLRKRSGLSLSNDKSYLLHCRLAPVAREAGLESLSHLVAALATQGDPALVAKVVEAMTTNESSFFRDKVPFDTFRDHMVPQLQAARAARRAIRVWCAASSSGQEPYSLAMMVRENQERLAGWRVDILATELSTAIAARGQAGRYSQFEVQRGLPIQLLVKYFEQVDGAWQIDDAIRKMVRWKVFNLLDSFSGLGTFDVIFCRNVLIYFDCETKSDVLDRLADALEPDGYLVLGGAETVLGLTNRLEPVPGKRGLYQRSAAAAARGLLRRSA